MRLLYFQFRNQNRPLKGTEAKRDVCRGSSVSTAVKFPDAPAESSTMTIVVLYVVRQCVMIAEKIVFWSL